MTMQIKGIDDGKIPPQLTSLSEHDPDMPVVFSSFFVRVVSAHKDMTRSRHQDAGQHFDDRGFARSILSQQADCLSFGDRKRDVLDRPVNRVFLGHQISKGSPKTLIPLILLIFLCDGLQRNDVHHGAPSVKKQYYPLTSVDMDPEICRIFQLRQRMEGHSNPSRVVCEDFLAYKQLNAFLKNGGWLFLMNLEKYHGREEINALLEKTGFTVVATEEFDRYPSIRFYCMFARKARLSEGRQHE